MKLIELPRCAASENCTVKQTFTLEQPAGQKITREDEYETTQEDSEARQILSAAAQSFLATIEFYKSEYGGGKSHDEALKETLRLHECRRAYVEGLSPVDVSWGHLAALAEVPRRLLKHGRVCEPQQMMNWNAGSVARKWPATVPNLTNSPRDLVIRDSFADQWQPQGGIESALIEMLTMAFSLQMYWTAIGHDRAVRIHDEQRKQLERYETSGWKSPYQSEADGIEQAHRLADGYNRQFLRVLRQLRDLRRYAAVVIQNAQQVNVGNQQMNVSR